MATKTSASKESQSNRYKVKYEQNRRRRILRAIKKYPNNEQLQTHLSSIVYRRSKPNNTSTTLGLKRSIELTRVLQRLAATKSTPNRSGMTFSV